MYKMGRNAPKSTSTKRTTDKIIQKWIQKGKRRDFGGVLVNTLDDFLYNIPHWHHPTSKKHQI